MKKTIGVTISVIVVVALSLVIIPTTLDKTHWQQATDANTVPRFELYVQLHSEGKHVAEARENIESLHWQEAIDANTRQGFWRYLQLHGEGKHVAEARENIESLNWQEAIDANTIPEFERYVRIFGAGKHVVEAKENIESLHWQEATDANTVPRFEQYVQLHSEGKHVVEAKENIESLPWREAIAANTIRSYQNYISTHPQGRFTQQAATKTFALGSDEALYEAALRVGTEASLKQFLSDFPGHQKEANAQQVIKYITEGLDIFDLLRETKIEIETQGSGLESVSIRLRKLVPYPITVRVPVGSYFVSARPSTQNMIATAESRVRLTSDDWRDILVSAACANADRNVPRSSTKFDIRLSPPSEDLKRLIVIIGKSNVGKVIKQVAVWIVTDNISRAKLDSRYRLPGDRYAASSEAVIKAMQIVEEAGIDISRKAISRVSAIRALSSKDKMVLDYALKLLGIKIEDRIELLTKDLKNRDWTIRRAAARVIGETKDAQAVDSLIDALARESDKTKSYMLYQGMRLETIQTQENKEHEAVSLAIARALHKKVEPLIIALQDTSSGVREDAAGALGQIQDRRAIKPLIDVLNDIDKSVQQSAAYALKTITGEDFGLHHTEWNAWWKQNKETLLAR